MAMKPDLSRALAQYVNTPGNPLAQLRNDSPQAFQGLLERLEEAGDYAGASPEDKKLLDECTKQYDKVRTGPR